MRRKVKLAAGSIPVAAMLTAAALVSFSPGAQAERAGAAGKAARASAASKAVDPNVTGVAGKPRVIVTTDEEKDDSNSLIRYLLMSDEFTTEGLIVASSEYHWAGDGKGTRYFVDGDEYTHFPSYIPDPCPCTSYRWPSGPGAVQQALAAYQQVYPNLKAQDPAYPTPAELESKYAVGNISYEGDMAADTPGSDLIKQVLLDDKPGPVFLLAWGGESTIARALESIQLQYQHTPEWPAIYKKVSRKAIIQASGQQDDTQASYIVPNWPDIRINYPASTGGPGGSVGYAAELSATTATAPYYSPAWIGANITSKGPFGALYYTWGDGRQMVPGDVTDFMWLSGYTTAQLQAMGYFVWMPPQPKGSFLGEGDTGTYLNLLDNGLRDDENLSWGGYSGGRYLPYLMDEEAARLQWSVTPDYQDANHPPVVSVRGPVDLTAAPGTVVHLTGSATDPDGNALTYLWYEDTSVDTYPGTVTLDSTNAPSTSFTVPQDAVPGQTIHMILQVTDDGTPSLARYQRVVITVEGAGQGT